MNPSRSAAALAIISVLVACNSDDADLVSDAGTTTGDAFTGNTAPARTPPESEFDLANACFALASKANGASVIKDGNTYRATGDEPVEAIPFYMKPSGLGSYLFFDTDRQLLAVDDPLGSLADDLGGTLIDTGNQVDGTGDVINYADDLRPVGDIVNQAGAGVAAAGTSVQAVTGPGTITAAEVGAPAEWAIRFDQIDGFSITSTANGQRLTVSPDTGELVLADSESQAARFDFVPHTGCEPFPEAELGATGEPFSGTNPDGTVFGFADTHVHLMAFERLGGRVIHGAPFHRFGVTHALDDCAEDHGPEGSLDIIGNFQRSGAPTDSHSTPGWPSFPGWPVFDTLTHQQTYYIWLKRAWMGGLRLVVNHLSADEALCQVAPLKRNGCEEMENIRLQVGRIHELQDYIDAQAGGPGEGWFRIVEEPDQARRVIEEGKLAVVLGIESSKIFGCGEFMDAAECNRADIDTSVEEFHALGIRSIFPAHWFDNAVAGPGLFGPTELTLNLFNKLETGHYYRVEQCPEEGLGANQQSFGQHFPGDDPLSQTLNEVQFAGVPTYPPGPHCNALGLTELGEHLIQSLIEHGIVIETDHTSAKAKNRILEIAEAADYPVISGHFGTGGITSPAQTRRIFAVGGMASPFNATAPELIDAILRMAELQSDEHYFGVGFASDAGGLAAQPEPREDAGERPLEYPFTSFDGQVTFSKQRTGERVYDLNTDGVAHYGLYADLIADMQRHPGGAQALELFFRSAEAYLQMWERAANH